MFELVSIDVETTGLTEGVHEVCSLSLQPFSISHDGCRFQAEMVHKGFNTLVSIYRPSLMTEEAMEINGLTLAELELAPTPLQVRTAVYDWFQELFAGKKMLAVGQNYGFDERMLRVFFGEAYDKMFEYWHVDTKSFAAVLQLAGHIPSDVSLSLSPLCSHFDLPLVPHDSKSDSLASIHLLVEMLNLIGKGD